jgi:hypothetical protein
MVEDETITISGTKAHDGYYRIVEEVWDAERHWIRMERVPCDATPHDGRATRPRRARGDGPGR